MMRALKNIANLKYMPLLAIMLLFSCSKSKYVELPSMLENQIPSQDRDMQFNIWMDKKELPDKIKTVYQVKDKDTINILEFDEHKNLIFKHYKQFEGDYWHDKYIFMIEANVYKGNKLVKTYYLHSNTGYDLFLYSYDGDNINKVEKYHLDNIKGVNTNQYSFIKKIKDYKSCIDFAGKLDIKGKGKFDYKTSRMFGNHEVKQYGDNKNYQVFKLNDKDQVEQIEYYAKGRKWENDSKFFKYDTQGKLMMAYSMNHRDTLKYTRYKYNNEITTVIKREFGKITITKTYLNNKLIYAHFDPEDRIDPRTDTYTLDRYGFPESIIENDGGKIVSYTFKNYYEFYK